MIQEALLSKRVIVMCGNKEVDLVYFIQVINDKGFRKNFLMKEGPKKRQLLAERSFEDINPKEEFKHPEKLSEQIF